MECKVYETKKKKMKGKKWQQNKKKPFIIFFNLKKKTQINYCKDWIWNGPKLGLDSAQTMNL